MWSLGISAVNAANVQFNEATILGAPANWPITISLESGGAFVLGSNIVSGSFTLQPTNGSVTASNLAPLVYTIEIENVSGRFRMPVPGDTNTYQAVDLLAEGVCLGDPEFHIAAGTNAQIVTNEVLGIYTLMLSASAVSNLANVFSTASGAILSDSNGDLSLNTLYSSYITNKFGINSDAGALRTDGSGNVTAQSYTGNGGGLTGLNGSAIGVGLVATNFLPGPLAALAASNAAALTNLSGSAIASGTVATNYLPPGLAAVAAANGSNLTNLQGTNVAGPLYNVVLYGSGASNAVTVSPTNIYYDLAGTVSTTNGQNKWSVSSSNVLANMHIGDNIIISNTAQQYRIVQFLGPTGGGQSPPNATGFVTLQNAAATMLNSNIQVFPNAVNFTDINRNPQGSIGNDAGLGVLGEFFANSGRVYLDNGSNTWYLDGYQGGPDSGEGFTISQMNIAPVFWIENGTPYNGMGMFRDNEFYLGGSGAGAGTITNVNGGAIKFPTGVSVTSGNFAVANSSAQSNVTTFNLTVSNAPVFQHTNTVPSNTNGPKLWVDFTNGGSVYKIPAYQ